LDACEKIKANLGSGVSADAALEYGDHLVGEFRYGAWAMGYWSRLEAVEFVEFVVY
jgi:hypothetical protein